MSKSKRHLTYGPTGQRLECRLAFETLEARMLLDSAGFLTGTDVHLTLSFAADGTQIAGQSNALAATFDSIAPEADWQEVILRAFQTWAVNTNADIGIVSDGGQSFGTAGPSQKDPRFGDIRIGAIAMEPNVGAVSVPVDGLVSGTWFADVVFNTAFNFQTLDDISAIALHEAGNVFGLKDNNDPNSPLFPGNPPVVRLPTANDIAALQDLHGVRAPDFNETTNSGGPSAPTNNDSFANATEFKLGETISQVNGGAPSVLYGDISDNADLDYYFFQTPSNYSGPMTVDLRSAGISLLTPRLRVFDINQQLLDEVESTNLGGDVVSIQIPSTSVSVDYYFEISGVDPGALGMGGYSLVAKLDGINEIDQAKIDAIAGGAFRFLEQDEIAKFFDADEIELYSDDLHTDDTFFSALELNTAPGFVLGTRYETVGSISDAADTDHYTVKSPLLAPTPLDVMTVLVRSLDAGGLVPRVSVFDGGNLPVAATILSNGSGEYIVQVVGVMADEAYTIKVEAATPGSFFDTGNYSLVVSFGSVATQLTSLASATIGAGVTQRTHTLYIGEPQLFHLALRVDAAATTTPTALVATIVNDLGTPVFQLAAQPGETRTREAVLLAPGTYTVEIIALTLDGSVPPQLSYTLDGLAISDPFVGDPNDPTANPFACSDPGLAGFFCYPGGITTADPFLWDNFIDSLTNPPTEPDVNTLVTILFGDWWTWVWSEFGVNGPPFAQNDTFHSQQNSPLIVPSGNGAAGGGGLSALLTVPGAGGILSNDIDPENSQLVTLLQTDVLHGSLDLSPDGGFVYIPDSGFSGIDQFTYKAFDFSNESNLGIVKIVVGISADFDASGGVSGADFLAWQLGAGTSTGASLGEGDADFDGTVGQSDLDVWEQQFGTFTAPTPSNGDANGDGDVDGADFLAWQLGFGITGGGSASDGDANADGAVNSVDLNIWEANYGQTFAASLALSSSVASVAPAEYVLQSPAASIPLKTTSSGTVPVSSVTAEPLTASLSSTPLFSTQQLQSTEAQSQQAIPEESAPLVDFSATRTTTTQSRIHSVLRDRFFEHRLPVAKRTADSGPIHHLHSLARSVRAELIDLAWEELETDLEFRLFHKPFMPTWPRR